MAESACSIKQAALLLDTFSKLAKVSNVNRALRDGKGPTRSAWIQNPFEPAPFKRRPPREHQAMNVRPLHDRLLVKRIEEEVKTKGGLIIPDTAKEKPMEGKVIAVGKGKVDEDGHLRPLDVRKGDRVLFAKYSGAEIRLAGDEHLIIREDDVLAVLD